MSFTPQNSTVWFEIPVRDLDRAMAFYSEVFGFDLKAEQMGPNLTSVFPVADPATGVSGHLYPGTPSEGGPTIHFPVPDGLDAARQRLEKAGGTVVSPDIDIPAGTFFYAKDPDGNSIGLFAAKG